ncbi:integrase [Helicobacter phage FrG12G]|nr:integrase [Helicobacter phage FrG12G]
MHKHTIYLRGNALYLNYTKNNKRHRVGLNNLIKSLNLESDKALEYLEGLSLEKILKMLKGMLKPNKEPKQESQRTAKNITIAQAKESFLNQKIGLKAESLRFMRLRFNTILKLLNIKESAKVSKITKESVTNYHNNALKSIKKIL